MNDFLMACNDYLIDYDSLLNLISEKGFKKILVQAPDGLKPIYDCLRRLLRERFTPKVEVIHSSSPTYGGCDVAYGEARTVGAELIVHVGHNRYPWIVEEEIPVHYVPAYYNWVPNHGDLVNLIDLLKKRGSLKIGLASTIQHVISINRFRRILEEAGFEVYVPKHALLEEGQILGCYYNHLKELEREVDSYVVISGGLFHPLGLALITNKPVVGFDPYTTRILDASVEAEKVLAKRFYLMAKLRYGGFRRVCVLIGCKPGQHRPSVYRGVGQTLEEKGFEPLYVASCILDRDRLVALDNALKPDVFVVTSCPRLPIDDLDDFYKPVLTPGELHMVLEGLDTYIYPW